MLCILYTDKKEFYEKITRVYDRLPENAIKTVLGDVNAEIEKELIYGTTNGLESAYAETNDNGQRIITFTTSRNLVISNVTLLS